MLLEKDKNKQKSGRAWLAHDKRRFAPLFPGARNVITKF